MGYYSLYKIVKDITRTIFGHKFWRKFLIICILAIIIWFVLHNMGYCVEDTNDINFNVKSYYDGVVNDAIVRLNYYFEENGRSGPIYSLVTNSNFYYYFYYGNVDGSDYLGGRPITNNNLHIGFRNRVSSNPGTVTSYDYLGQQGYSLYTVSLQHISFSNSTISYNTTGSNTYYPVFVVNYVNENWQRYITALVNNDNQTIIDLLEDIKEETQTTNDILTDSSIDNSVINDLNSGYTATSEGITNNDTTFQLGETKENVWLTQFKTAFNGLSYRLPSTINLTLPYVNKNLSIRSDILSSHITGTQFESIVIAFWWVFFGMRIYRLVKRIVIHFASGEILNSEAQQSGPWKLHELLQYEIDRVGLDTFI